MGLIMMGFGSLMFALPHFITDEYITIDNLTNSDGSSNISQDLCVDGSTGFISLTDEDIEKAAQAGRVGNGLINFINRFFF
jgi:hypothetical protein